MMITRKIKVVYHNKEYKLQQHGNWIDLAVSRRYFIHPNSFRMLDLGISMQLPKYYEANIVPRSSTFKKFNITLVNSIGIIDSEYCGMNDVWQFPALSHKYKVEIRKNTRIAQFTIRLSMNAPVWVKILDLFTKFKFVEVDRLNNKNRGGFGSSGQ